jgi:DNA-binding transcriptional LysR family regulator
VTIPEPPDAAGRAPAAGLRVAHVPGVTLTKWRGIWAERLRRVPLRILDVTEADQRSALDEGLADMVFVRLPMDTAGAHVIPLYDEVPVVVVPKDHRLAEQDEVSLADLDGETLVVGDAEASAVERVAWGAGVARVPHSIARSESRGDLVYRPVTDAEPTTIALAWLVDNPNELIEEFIGIVRGRTANSSRTAAARSVTKEEPVPPKPARTPRRPVRGRGSQPRSGRAQRRR